MKKQFILDTTVLLYDPNALYAFEENTIVIPIVVIEDIDRFKKDLTENGRNARQTSRWLDELRAQGSLTEGVAVPGGGQLLVRLGTEHALERLPAEFRERRRDNVLLAIVLDVKEHAGEVPTVLVTKDINLRIRADALGITVQDYESDKVDLEELYTGTCECTVGAAEIEAFARDGRLAVTPEMAALPLFPNQYVSMNTSEGSLRPVYGRFDADTRAVVRLITPEKEAMFKLTSRNAEQAFAVDALLNDDILMVTLVGIAGTGKTLVAVAASLYKTVVENAYSRVLVSRPTLPMGKDIGFLPGTVEEKLTPWMYPIADNVEYLMRSEGKMKRKGPGFKELIDMGILVIEPLTFIRGRSIHNQFLIVDEAQNLTPHEIKTIITRVGDGTKIVVTGDPYQIDNPYIDSSSNGLTYLVERFKRERVSAHITLKKGERSLLSELAANLL